MILVTGGCGFIGSNFTLRWLAGRSEPVTVLDALTYAGNPANLAPAAGDPRLTLVRGDIRDAALTRGLLRELAPRAVIHFAAETHVDRSIEDPAVFYETNVQGTVNLLEASRLALSGQSEEKGRAFRFLHVSTDEVYGSLGPQEPPASEDSPFRPNSPYAASKAAAELAVRAWGRTYGLPVLITRCSNNYGPRQHPEKLVPLAVTRILAGEPIPVYGDGRQVRDWIEVGDHCDALMRVLEGAAPGSVYNLAGSGGVANIDLLRTLCRVMDVLRPQGAPSERLITFVRDRPAHDARYALCGKRFEQAFGAGASATPLAEGLRRTASWYLGNPQWLEGATSGEYRGWVSRQYGGGAAR